LVRELCGGGSQGQGQEERPKGSKIFSGRNKNRDIRTSLGENRAGLDGTLIG
jgi:hypothetical protein